MTGWTKSRSRDYWARSDLYKKGPSPVTIPELQNRDWLMLASEAKELIEGWRRECNEGRQQIVRDCVDSSSVPGEGQRAVRYRRRCSRSSRSELKPQ